MPDIKLHLDGVSVASSAVIKNLGVTFDPDLCFKTFLGLLTFLRNIAKIRKMLSVHDAEKLVHTFVTSRLIIVMPSGCANASVEPLQVVQNAAACILTRTKCFEHMSIRISPLATYYILH